MQSKRQSGAPNRNAARRPFLSILGVTLCVAFVVLTAQVAGLLNPFRDAIFDIRFTIKPKSPTENFVFVAIDAKSIRDVGQWPWPRKVHASLIERLFAAGVSEVALDIDFSSPSDEGNDAALETAMARAEGPVTLPIFEQTLTNRRGDTATIVTEPLPRFAQYSFPAIVNVQPESDGMVRTFASAGMVGGLPTPTFAAAITNQRAEVGVRYYFDSAIDVMNILTVSASDVLNGRIDREQLSARRAIVGSSAVELGDFVLVPRHGLIPGPLFHLLVAETISQERTLKKTSTAATITGFAILVFLSVWLIRRCRWWTAILFLGGVVAVIEVLAYAGYIYETILVDTAGWLGFLMAMSLVTVLRENDIRLILMRIARIRADNTEQLLGRVVADNFDGIIIFDDNLRVLSNSRTAAEILSRMETDTVISDVSASNLPSPILSDVKRAIASEPNAGNATIGPKEIELTRGDGSSFILAYVVKPSWLADEIVDANSSQKRCVACLTFRDVTEHRLSERRLRYLATHDPLTGLLNRAEFENRVKEALSRVRVVNEPPALLCIDLDRFKTINDTLGHEAGDKLLVAVSRRLQSLCRPYDLMSRFGGDEFIIYCAAPGDRDAIARFADTVVATLSEPFDLDGNQALIGASVGIFVFDSHQRITVDFVRFADTALYHAKNENKGSWAFFDPKMNDNLQRRRKNELDLARALERQELKAYYQPQFSLAEGRLNGAETLVRWLHPTRGLVNPGEFIAIAEETGLITEIGRWILDTACREAALWPDPVKVAVNLSPIQIQNDDIVKTVETALKDSGLTPERLDLEITESVLMRSSSMVNKKLDDLVALGVRLVLDDFGTGYSSLSYLNQYPIDKVKIDQGFVCGLPNNVESLGIIRAIVGMAESLGLGTTAEGIESRDQLEILKYSGCQQGQGYLFGKPMSGEDFEGLLLSNVAANRVQIGA